MSITETALTREEDAYAHLASFQSGDVVDVSGPRFFQPGIVTQAQVSPDGDMSRAHLFVGGCGVRTVVALAGLLSGEYRITALADARAGKTRYFDAVSYAAQQVPEPYPSQEYDDATYALNHPESQI
jgi:hypothetical protein